MSRVRKQESTADVSAPAGDRGLDAELAELQRTDAFLAGGYARLSHFRSARWKEYFALLEGVSSRFNELVWEQGGEDYNWPLDPLHCWSRAWEYPFVAAHLGRIWPGADGAAPTATIRGEEKPRVLDVGAAVTFFSAYLAQQGFDLTNFDHDQAMLAQFERAFDRIEGEMELRSRPAYVIGDARDTKLPDQSYDAVLCISVLEHIPSWQRAMSEFIRILRPGGVLILTFDIKYKGDPEGLTYDEAGTLIERLNENLVALTDQDQTVPADALHMKNSPFLEKTSRGGLNAGRLLLPLKRAAKLQWPFKPAADLCVFGGLWQKQTRGGNR